MLESKKNVDFNSIMRMTLTFVLHYLYPRFITHHVAFIIITIITTNVFGKQTK